MKLRWRFGVVSAIFLSIFCLYPQMKMLYLRGSEWNGHYAYNDIDEVAYASYIHALIDGRPRKNDPYSGRDDSSEKPQPESLFSIQFAAPYTVALPARVFGIGTPWAMTLSGAVAGFLAALGAFWLVARITGSNWYGMAGSLVIFAGGALAAGEGAMSEVFFDGFSYPYFPGFRRYIPAMALTAVFALFAVVWKLLANAECGTPNAESVSSAGKVEDEPRFSTTVNSAFRIPRSEFGSFRIPNSAFGAAAVFLFAYTVFSYFYIWTTAAAWLGCLFMVWLVFRPEGFRRDLKSLVAVGVGCALALVPYAWLLSKRSETMDDVQLLVYTRVPDVSRVPEFISIACLLMLAFGVAKKIIGLRDRAALFGLSLALVPLIVFNQQIVTGRSLQPIHYQVFIGNYVAALALVITIGIMLRERLAKNGRLPRAACAAVTVVAVVWGFVECHYTVRVLDESNIERDLSLPVARRLEELSREEVDPHRSTVLAVDMIQSDDLPSVAPQNVLWSRHQHVFAGMSWQENKDRYFQFLYYLDADESSLDYLLKNDFAAKIALFGWGRHTDRLTSEARPLTQGEIDMEVRRFGAYRAGFNAANAADPILSYAVVETDYSSDLTNLDKWYKRDAGEVIGKYTLYRLKQRSE
ncbi:MAG: hypothetical protein ABIO91_00570 [Pyrinomonadaceae bacterium]